MPNTTQDNLQTIVDVMQQPGTPTDEDQKLVAHAIVGLVGGVLTNLQTIADSLERIASCESGQYFDVRRTDG